MGTLSRRIKRIFSVESLAPGDMYSEQQWSPLSAEPNFKALIVIALAFPSLRVFLLAVRVQVVCTIQYLSYTFYGVQNSTGIQSIAVHQHKKTLALSKFQHESLKRYSKGRKH